MIPTRKQSSELPWNIALKSPNEGDDKARNLGKDKARWIKCVIWAQRRTVRLTQQDKDTLSQSDQIHNILSDTKTLAQQSQAIHR